jgi:glutamate-1-semialdehyde 2,1-aminomutase
MGRSEELFARAKRVLPGGVNSPVRAFGAVGETPRFLTRAEGCRVTDADGREYIDYVASWGPMILGHNHPAILEAVERAARDGLSFGAPTEREVELAELMCRMVPGLETVRMTSSGTEAVMSAVRLARHVTGRGKILKFAGCYHGHADGMLVRAGSGALTLGQPDSGGVPPEVASLTLVAEYNDMDSVRAAFAANQGEVAAVILEPAAANMGLVAAEPEFLRALRELCDREGALLIFDEVITGFRLARGGARELFDVRADLMTYGKIIGGGMPVGAFGGARALMEHIAPSGAVYHAGTLSGNPVAMAAGLAQLRILDAQPELYTRLARAGGILARGLRDAAAEVGARVGVNQLGSLVTVFFTDAPVRTYADARGCDTDAFARYFRAMLARGIYLPPSQFESLFLGAAHTDAELAETIAAARAAFAV